MFFLFSEVGLVILEVKRTNNDFGVRQHQALLRRVPLEDVEVAGVLRAVAAVGGHLQNCRRRHADDVLHLRSVKFDLFCDSTRRAMHETQGSARRTFPNSKQTVSDVHQTQHFRLRPAKPVSTGCGVSTAAA